jgi:hypothetical protein
MKFPIKTIERPVGLSNEWGPPPLSLIMLSSELTGLKKRLFSYSLPLEMNEKAKKWLV